VDNLNLVYYYVAVCTYDYHMTHLIPCWRPFVLPQLIHSLKGLGMVFHQPALGSFQLLTLQIKTLTVNGETVPFLVQSSLAWSSGGRER